MSKNIELAKASIVADVLEMITSPNLTPKRVVELGIKYQDLANTDKESETNRFYFSASRIIADLSHMVLNREDDLRVAGLAIKRLKPVDQLMALMTLKLPEDDMKIVIDAAEL